jgi:lipoate-protein ligase A
MALDEALLEAISRLGAPLLRFYGWTEPAATFGYSQRFAEVSRVTRLRPLIRRPTGGGLVPHSADWTYSLVFPPGHAWTALSATESYRRVHTWIRDALVSMGVKAELATTAKKDAKGACFAGHERFDVLCQKRKIAGAAQRRNHLGLLIQGSIQPPRRLARAHWEKAMSETARKQWGVEWRFFRLDDAFFDRTQQLLQEKYSREDYNRMR